MIQEKTPLTGVPLLLAPPAKSKPQNDGLGRNILTGYLLIGAMAAVTFGWMANTSLSGAVVGSGRVIVESEEKVVQHPAGGVVGQILVQEGSMVREGDLLLRLDDTALKANLDIIESDLSALNARLARLRAERDGTSAITYPDSMNANPTEADRDSMRTENQVFLSRRLALGNKQQQLRSKIAQLQEQAHGNSIMMDSRQKELTMVNTSLITSKDLLNKKLSTRSQTIQLEQTAIRLEGEYGRMVSDNATLKAQIAETELQINGLGADQSAEVLKDLRDTEAKIAEAASRRIAARDQLSRIEIRSPARGAVHELAVHTVGGVVTPGEPIMKIVPDHQPLIFEVRVNPTDIDQVQVGQKAMLKFPAFNRSRTPEITGTVTMVGADASTDRQTGRGYYDVRITPEAAMNDKLKENGIILMPGMPAEAFMETDERTALSYLLKPLTDQIEHAFREE